MKALGFILIAVAVNLALGWATVCWQFRDGLGPGSVTSTGGAALSRFWEGFGFSLVIIIPLAAIGGCCLGWRRRAPLNQMSSSPNHDT